MRSLLKIGALLGTLDPGVAMAVVTYEYPVGRVAPVLAQAFTSLDLRVGTVASAAYLHDPADERSVPALKLEIDFGEGLNTTRFKKRTKKGPASKERRSTAQLADRYTFPGDVREGVEQLTNIVGMQVVTAINFPNKQIGKIMSRFLTLGAVFATEEEGGTVVLSPDVAVPNGAKVFLQHSQGRVDCQTWEDATVESDETVFKLDIRVRDVAGQGRCLRIENIEQPEFEDEGGFLAVEDADGNVVPIRTEREVAVGTMIK